MPSARAISYWQQQYPDFARALDRAREMRADARIEKISDLANRIEAGKLDPNAGRVAIDAQKWLAAKENWRKWGDRHMAAVAVEARPYDEATTKSTRARDEFLARLSKYAERQQPIATPGEVEIITPVPAMRRPASRVEEAQVVEPSPEPAAKPEPTKAGEFDQMVCVRRPPFERRELPPHVIANGRFRTKDYR